MFPKMFLELRRSVQSSAKPMKNRQNCSRNILGNAMGETTTGKWESTCVTYWNFNLVYVYYWNGAVPCDICYVKRGKTPKPTENDTDDKILIVYMCFIVDMHTPLIFPKDSTTNKAIPWCLFLSIFKFQHAHHCACIYIKVLFALMLALFFP